jgi:DNA-binding ferritin-like protein
MRPLEISELQGQGGEKMDIQNINALTESAKTSRQNTTQTQVKEFQDYLDAFSEKSIAEDTSPARTCGNIKDVQPIPFVNMTSPQKEMVEKVDSVLNLFETYARNLSNPAKSLKELEPALLNMKQAAERLSKENLRYADKALSQLVNNIQVAASIEHFKFQRGDYL